jgi:phosphoserine phosphatase
VSASPLAIVLAGAKVLRIPAERCAGIEVRIVDGRFTDEPIEPVTYAEGKVLALPVRGWKTPAIACGDSLHGDKALLESAKIGVVVAASSDSPLARLAPQRGWFVLGTR